MLGDIIVSLTSAFNHWETTIRWYFPYTQSSFSFLAACVIPRVIWLMDQQQWKCISQLSPCAYVRVYISACRPREDVFTSISHFNSLVENEHFEKFGWSLRWYFYRSTGLRRFSSSHPRNWIRFLTAVSSTSAPTHVAPFPPPAQPATFQIQRPTLSDTEKTLTQNPATLFSAPSSSTLRVAHPKTLLSGRATDVSHDLTTQLSSPRNSQLERITQLLERKNDSHNQILESINRLAAGQSRLLESMNLLAVGHSRWNAMWVFSIVCCISIPNFKMFLPLSSNADSRNSQLRSRRSLYLYKPPIPTSSLWICAVSHFSISIISN